MVYWTFTALALPCLYLAIGIHAQYDTCDEPVDVIFVFDHKPCITMARDVLVHYKTLVKPETKLKVGVAFCARDKVEYTGPEAGLSHLLMITENLQHSGLAADLSPHDVTHLPDRVGLRAENTPYPVYEITDVSFSGESCLKTVGSMFDAHGNDKSMKMAVLVATQKTWADPRHLEEAATLKGAPYNSTLAVIAAGIKSGESIRVLEKMASDPTKFMTLTSTNDLHDVSHKFTKGACRLTNVDLSTPSFPVSMASLPTSLCEYFKSLSTCEQLSESTYEVRTHMGPLGYVKETMYCDTGSRFDVTSCSCAGGI